MAAAALGLPAIAIADRNSLAGVVRAHLAAKEVKIQLLVGARLVSADGPELLCFPTDRAAYGRLCRLLTLGRSEEHTSELQSLMRISYAVFCLKKKKNNKTLTLSHNTQEKKVKGYHKRVYKRQGCSLDTSEAISSDQ